MRHTVLYLKRRAERVSGRDMISRFERNFARQRRQRRQRTLISQTVCSRETGLDPEPDTVSMQVMHPKVTLDRERDV